MEQATMQVVDSSYFDNDGENEEINGELIPIADMVDPEGDDYEDNSGLTIKQVLPEQEEQQSKQTETQTQELDVVELLLKNKGIVDPHAILFEDEDGIETTRDFYELSREEQLDLLESNDSDLNYGLEDDEVETINYLRENNITLSELIDYYKKEAVEEYQNANQADFEIDNYTDEELYVLDLKAKYDELTNEELEIELTKALESPDLFKKKADKIRGDYKTLEQESRNAEKDEQLASQDEAFSQIINVLADVATNTDDMYGITLEDQDKEDIINLIIDRDLNGVTPLVKALDNPEQLFKAAWFISKGEEAFSILHNYYKQEIENVRKASYQKGKEESVKGLPSKPINRITYGTQPRTTTSNKPMHIDDFYNNIND